MLEEFLNSVAVVDVEANSLDTKSAEIIELGIARYHIDTWETKSLLLKSQVAIPPACSAICNITNRMVKDNPLFAEATENIFDLFDFSNTKYFVAHNIRYDTTVLSNNFRRSGLDFDIVKDLEPNSWICSFRLAKILLADEKGEMQFNQQFLRYWLNVDVSENWLPHRAGSDAYVCGHVFEKLVQMAIAKNYVKPEEDIGKQLSELCQKPRELVYWPFGKHKGKLFAELPNSYLEWAILNLESLDNKSVAYDMDLAAAIEKEILVNRNYT